MRPVKGWHLFDLQIWWNSVTLILLADFWIFFENYAHMSTWVLDRKFYRKLDFSLEICEKEAESCWTVA